MDATIENKKEFIDLLKNYNMKDEEKMFMLLNQYLEKMDEHMNVLTQELVSVKKELSDIQDNTLKAKMTKASVQLENTVSDTRQQTSKLKNDIAMAIQSGIEQSKLYGKESIMNAISGMHIIDIMNSLKTMNKHIIQKCDGFIDVLTNIANESHKALEHSKNAFKTIAGKEVESPGNHNFDKGFIAGLQKGLFRIMETSMNFNQKISSTIESINQINEKVEIERETNKSIRERIANAKDTQKKIQNEKSRDIPEKDAQLGKELNPAR